MVLSKARISGWKCLFMVLVEGIKMNAKCIPKKQIVAAWKTLSSKAFPKVKALKLNDDDFNHVLQHGTA